LSDLIAELQRTSLVIYVRELPHFDSAPSCFLRPVKVPWVKCTPTLTRRTVERRMAAYNQIIDDELHLSLAGGRRFAQNSGLSAALIEAMYFGGLHG